MATFAGIDSFQNACPGHVGGPPGYLVAQLIQTLIAAHCGFNNPGDYPRDYGEDISDNEEFDFIIVGAGSSGSVVASRLSENPKWKVLLVEAGGDPNFISDVPSFLFSTQGSDIDWKYYSEKHENSCLGMIDQKCFYPRGKVLGGSSSINAMLYVRGNARDFDEWEEHGNRDWNYENVLKYFKRSENLNGFYLANHSTYEDSLQSESLKGRIMSEEYHSTEGPLSVSPFASGSLDSVKNVLFGAFKELNVSSLMDINGKSQVGISNAPGTLFQGTRANTAKMFLNPVKNRSNLFVVKHATAKKLIIENNEVKGVEFVRDGKSKVVIAGKEVVVSAGSINSPKLLLLSGIGPEERLKSIGIPPVLNLKGVGENLQDHFVFFGAAFSILKSVSEPVSPMVPLDAMYHFLTKRSGLFSSIGLTDLVGFIDTVNNDSVPDVQYHFVHFSKEDSYLLPEILRVLNFNDDLKGQYLNMVKESSALIIMPTVLRPAGRGRVLLRSSDFRESPAIHADILKDSEDIETLLRGVKFISKLKETKSFQRLEPQLVKIDIPECDAFDFESDLYWKCLMKYVTSSIYHPVGTCKMGPKSDPLAVVDDRLRVHGVKNLRVADASIMPTIVRGNTNAPCIMIGEKCADFIKTHWERPPHTEL